MRKFFDEDFKNYNNVYCNKTFNISENILKKLNIKLSNEEFNLKLLKKEFNKVPLVRLFTHHGCPHKCTYCGDLSSRKIIDIPVDIIKKQLDEYKRFYPETKIMYISDKTFNVKNKFTDILIKLLKNEDYKLIVQTRPEYINQNLIDKMKKINVKVVELGFETASKDIREKIKKPQKLETVRNSIELLEKNNIKVILNVLFGIPYETNKTYRETFNFLKSLNLWLINGYIFVPYPETDLYETLKNDNRLIENNFNNWCENKPLVFKPYNLSIKEHYYWYEKIIKWLS